MSDSTSTEPNPALPSTPKKPKRWKRALFFLVVLALGSLGVSMYFLSYPIGWPALGHSSEPSLDERVAALTTRLDNATQAQSEAQARFEEALAESRSRVEALSEQLNARTRQLEGIEARLRDNTEALDQQALADERARQARQQNKRAIDALSQTLTDTIDQWDEGAVPATVDDQAVRALAREQARIVGVLQRLTEAEQHLKRLEVDSALKAYEAGLGLLRDQTSRRLQRLADQLEREYQAIQSWPQVDWAGHQRAVIDVGEALRSGHSATSQAATSPESARQAVAASANAAEGESLWRRIQTAASALVNVRPRDPAQLSAHEQAIVRAMLSQRLLLLESAIATRDVAMVSRHAAQVMRDLDTLGFEQIDRSVFNDLVGLEALDWPNDAQPPAQAKSTAQALLDPP